MRRPIYNPDLANKSQQDNQFHIHRSERQRENAKTMDKMKLNRMLRTTRSKQYIDAIHRLDAGGRIHNEQFIEEILQAIRDEFPETEISGILVGIVSICYLGNPYEVHTLTLNGQIIEHYKRGQVMPERLEMARALAQRGGYEFIEVYDTCCRAISSDGTVSVISC